MSSRTRILFVATSILLVALASGCGYFSQIAKELQTKPVYVESGSNPSITSSQAKELESIIKKGNKRLFIAVLRPTILKEVKEPNRLDEAVSAFSEMKGTYGILTGATFRATSTAGAGIENANELAVNAYKEHHKEGAFAVLKAFTESVENNESGLDPIIWTIIGMMLVGAAVYIIHQIKEKRKEQQASTTNVNN